MSRKRMCKSKFLFSVCFITFLIVGLGFLIFDTPRLHLPIASDTGQSGKRLFDGCSSQQLQPRNTLFTLMVPVPFNDKKHFEEFRELFLETLLFFWPLNKTNLVILSDYESPNREAFRLKCVAIAGQLNSTSFGFTKPSSVYKNDSGLPNDHEGWYRQQWYMFWADNFTSADYVGFADTDAVMVTVPIAGDLFIQEKPVLRCTYDVRSSTDNPMLDQWLGHMEWAVQTRMLIFCSAFPIIYRVDHIRKFRAHVIKAHNNKFRTFDDLFRKLRRKEFSQFMMFCNYVFHFHKREYVWRIQPFNVDNGPLSQEITMRTLGIDRRAVMPFYRISQHFHAQRYVTSLKEILRQGYCFFEEDRERATICDIIRENYSGIQKTLFTYENYGWIPYTTEIPEAYIARSHMIKRCNYRQDWNRSKLQELGLL